MNKPTTLKEAKKEQYGVGVKSKYIEGRCVQDVWEGWQNYQCTRKNGHGPDNLYCKQHAKKFSPAEPKQPPIVRLTATEKSFYSGIRTALNLLDLHGMDTIYDELVNMCNVPELVKGAIEDGELEFSRLVKHGYATTSQDGAAK